MKKKIIILTNDNLVISTVIKYILTDFYNFKVCMSFIDFEKKYLESSKIDENISTIIIDAEDEESEILSKKIKNDNYYKEIPIIAIVTYMTDDSILSKLIKLKEQKVFSELIISPFENIELFRELVKKYINM